MPKPTVNDIFREYASEFLSTHSVSEQTKKVIRAITDCRTEYLGGHIQKCDTCGHEVTLFNSCRNRHCPQCQFIKKEQWIDKKKNEVLPFQYFHTVFTIPDELNPIVIRNKKLIYKLLFDSTKETLLTVAEDDKYFGAKIGFFSILHTWGQKLNLHPHIHTVVPGGGYVEKKSKWISAPADYLVPVKVVMPRFRSIFLKELKRLYVENQLYLKGTVYQDKKCFQKLIDKMFNKEWIVYIKESFRNSDSVIEYLAKYTHRIAISNYRIISFEDGVVSFSYRDYADNNSKKVMKMPVMKFMERFLYHVVPYRFVRIRYYGLLSNCTAKKKISDCREYYQVKAKTPVKRSWEEIFQGKLGIDPCQCSSCKKGRMIMSEMIRRLARDGP